MLARDFPAAQDAIDRFPFDTLPSVFSGPVPKSYLEGCIASAQGNNREARQFSNPPARKCKPRRLLIRTMSCVTPGSASSTPTWVARKMRSTRGNGPQSQGRR